MSEKQFFLNYFWRNLSWNNVVHIYFSENKIFQLINLKSIHITFLKTTLFSNLFFQFAFNFSGFITIIAEEINYFTSIFPNHKKQTHMSEYAIKACYEFYCILLDWEKFVSNLGFSTLNK